MVQSRIDVLKVDTCSEWVYTVVRPITAADFQVFLGYIWLPLNRRFSNTAIFLASPESGGIGGQLEKYTNILYTCIHVRSCEGSYNVIYMLLDKHIVVLVFHHMTQHDTTSHNITQHHTTSLTITQHHATSRNATQHHSWHNVTLNELFSWKKYDCSGLTSFDHAVPSKQILKMTNSVCWNNDNWYLVKGPNFVFIQSPFTSFPCFYFNK